MERQKDRLGCDIGNIEDVKGQEGLKSEGRTKCCAMSVCFAVDSVLENKYARRRLIKALT